MNSENQSFSNQGVNQGQSQPQLMSTAQTDRYPASGSVEVKVPTSTESHSQVKSDKSSFNALLSRALVGGLIGTTVGLLAGRKVSEGLNRASKGVGKAFGTIGQGLGMTAKGVGEAAKSISDGVGYAVVGGTSEAAQNLADGVQQVASGTTKAIQQTGETVSQGVQQAASTVSSAVQQTSAMVGSAVQQTGDTVGSAVQQTGDTVSQTIDSTANQLSTSTPGQSVIERDEYTKPMAVDADVLEQSVFDNEAVAQPYMSSTMTTEGSSDPVMDFYESVEHQE